MKSKLKMKIYAFILLQLVFCTIVLAQGVPPGGGGGGGGIADAPIDGGVLGLLVAAATYGYKRLYSANTPDSSQE
jgi:hypothetical protein